MFVNIGFGVVHILLTHFGFPRLNVLSHMLTLFFFDTYVSHQLGIETTYMDLINALKAFPKDVPMRWEKIAAAVPGKSKACCMKRVAELKRDFRSSKASDAT